jgi:hypothetical protein
MTDNALVTLMVASAIFMALFAAGVFAFLMFR